jgi:hypothetical protein
MAKKSAVAKESSKEIVRVTFRFHGPELEQIREVRDMLSLNTEVDAARYLMQRGLEAISATLTSRRVQTKMASQVTTEAICKTMMGLGFTPEKEQ